MHNKHIPQFFCATAIACAYFTSFSLFVSIHKLCCYQVKTLELLVSQHEKDIKQKDALISKQKLELGKQAEVAALIHKLSSGNVNGNAPR